jgi:hypothetical protein
MKGQMRLVFGLALMALIGGCGTEQRMPATPSSAPPAATATAPESGGAPGREATFAAARSIALAAGPDGRIYAALGTDAGLEVAHTQPDGSWSQPALASADKAVLVNPVERPAIAVTPGGQPAVAWIEPGASERTVLWYAASADDGATFGAPAQVAAAEGESTAMVSLAFDAQQNPLAAWLQGEDLALARSDDGGRSFAAGTLDTTVCDCCQPAPLLADEPLVAFRNVVKQGEDDLRDIYVVRLDGARAAGAPVQVSDASWQINACPISGPAVALRGDEVYVAWMDGRADSEHSGKRSDIWLARSGDGGRSFGANLRVNAPEGQHTLPSLAAGPDGRLHLSWLRVAGQEYAIVYTSSADGGASFAPPRTIASSAAGKERGRPTMPALAAASDGRAYLAWTDKQGAHVVALGE